MVPEMGHVAPPNVQFQLKFVFLVRYLDTVTSLTLRRLMSYIYIYVYIEHTFLMFLDHTQRRSIVGRTPLDE